MTPDQITTVVSALFGYGGIAIAVDRLRKEFIAHKAEVKARLDALEKRAA